MNRQRQRGEYMLNKKDQVDKKLFIMIGVIAFLILMFLNILTPYVADDYSFRDSKSIFDIIHNGYLQYMESNGRVVAHFFARLFLMPNKMIFNIINSCVFIWLAICIYLHSGAWSKKKYNPCVFIFILLAIWIFVDEFGQTVLWLTGSCNYMWGVTIIVSFLLPYNMYLMKDRNFKSKYLSAVGMLILGILAGCSSENTSGGSILAIGIMMILCKVWKKVQPWMVTGLIGNIIGFALLIFCPGAYLRSRTYTDTNAFLIKLANRISNCTDFIQEVLLGLVILLIVLIIVQIYQRGRYKEIIMQLTFAVASIASLYALILSPAKQNGRVTFGVVILLIIACAQAFANVRFERIELRVMKTSFIWLLLLKFCITFITGVIDIGITKDKTDDRNQYVEDQIAMGATRVVVPFITPVPETKYNALHGLSDLSSNVDFWTNDYYAKEYGLEEVLAVDYNEWFRVYLLGEAKLISCDDFASYLELVNSEDYMILISVKDDSSKAMNKKIIGAMNLLGLKENLMEGYRNSYIAAIDGGKVMIEEKDKDVLVYNNVLNEKSVSILSQGKSDGINSLSSIMIDNVEYSKNRGGINIVVYNKITDRVVDSVNFKTWSDGTASR